MRIQTNVILGILVLQYILGMAINLFVQFPDTKNENSLWEFVKGQVPIVIHIILAAMLLVGACVLLIRAIHSQSKPWIVSAGVGLFWILVAIIAGAQFVPTQQDVYSFIMAAAFILAIVSYGWGMYKTKK